LGELKYWGDYHPKYKKEDQRLREELKNADIGKFKEELKRVFSPKKPLKAKHK